MSNLYEHKAELINGTEFDFSSLKGKVSLFVNTASKCGFTSQYKGLQKLFDTYKDEGFVVLGFPSNDFKSQEPGTNEEIVSFCETNYGVNFPLFKKAPVKGEEKQETYRLLTSAKDFEGDPGWNFVKFLVDKNGKVVKRYAALIGPKKIAKDLAQLLIG